MGLIFDDKRVQVHGPQEPCLAANAVRQIGRKTERTRPRNTESKGPEVPGWRNGHAPCRPFRNLDLRERGKGWQGTRGVTAGSLKRLEAPLAVMDSEKAFFRGGEPRASPGFFSSALVELVDDPRPSSEDKVSLQGPEPGLPVILLVIKPEPLVEWANHLPGPPVDSHESAGESPDTKRLAFEDGTPLREGPLEITAKEQTIFWSADGNRAPQHFDWGWFIGRRDEEPLLLVPEEARTRHPQWCFLDGGRHGSQSALQDEDVRVGEDQKVSPGFFHPGVEPAAVAEVAPWHDDEVRCVRDLLDLRGILRIHDTDNFGRKMRTLRITPQALDGSDGQGPRSVRDDDGGNQAREYSPR